MNHLETISKIKKEAEYLKKATEEKREEVRKSKIYSKASSIMSEAGGLVKSKISEIKQSTMYENGVEIVDAYKDARDAFRKMDAEEYLEYNVKRYYKDFKYTLIINGINVGFYSEYEIFIEEYKNEDELNQKIERVINRKGSCFNKVSLFKSVIDPIDNKKKIFKVGEFSKENNGHNELLVLCNDQYNARIVINKLESMDYVFKPIKKDGFVKRLLNSDKNSYFN